VAMIWAAFVERLRRQWQDCELLPFIDVHSSNSIDYGQCLLHQKLQMLQCCIRQKIKREQQGQVISVKETSSTTVPQSDHNDSNDSDEEDEEEFFDCDPEPIVEEGKPEGQLEVLTDSAAEVVYLLDQPEKPVYIPVTQEPAPMTEDHH